MADMTVATTFISYSHDDGEEFALKLHENLLEGGFRPWLDQKCIPPGCDWTDSIKEGLDRAGSILVVLTPCAMISHQVRGEWTYALDKHLAIVPLMVKTCEVPPGLKAIQFIDFRSDPAGAFARLPVQLRELTSNHLERLRRLRESFANLLAEPNNLGRLATKVADLDAVIGEWGSNVERQRERVAAAVTKPAEPLDARPPGPRPKSVRLSGRRPLDVMTQFKGRATEREALGRYLAGNRARMVSIIGSGGMGKTALACYVLQGLEDGIWPQDDEYRSVDGIAYFSTRTTGITAERIFLELAKLLKPEERDRVEKLPANRELSPADKVARLLETPALRDGRYVVLLDNMEDLVGEDGVVSDPEVRAFILGVVGSSGHGVRLVMTSREAIGLDPLMQPFDLHVVLAEGLSVADGVLLLRELDPNGDCGLRQAPEGKLAEVVRRTHGVPRALELVVSILKNNVFVDLDELLRNYYSREEVVEKLVDDNYRRLSVAAQGGRGAGGF